MHTVHKQGMRWYFLESMSIAGSIAFHPLLLPVSCCNIRLAPIESLPPTSCVSVGWWEVKNVVIYCSPWRTYRKQSCFLEWDVGWNVGWNDGNNVSCFHQWDVQRLLEVKMIGTEEMMALLTRCMFAWRSDNLKSQKTNKQKNNTTIWPFPWCTDKEIEIFVFF